MSKKNTLNQITICAIDCVNPELAFKAISSSLTECTFGDAILFTNQSSPNDSTIKNIEIDKINCKNEYSRFILKNLHKFIQTSYVLIVQWDGFVLDGNQWNDDFLDYDYIGAPWHWHTDGMNVGNGGFSLRSKKLLETLSKSDFPFIENMNEDDQICRLYRSKLASDYSIKFPSEELANKFSYERSLPNYPTFGFHGLFNMWRHLSDEEMVMTLSKINPRIFHTTEIFELLIQYFLMRKFNALQQIFKILRENCEEEEILNNIRKVTNDSNFTDWFITLLNRQ